MRSYRMASQKTVWLYRSLIVVGIVVFALGIDEAVDRSSGIPYVLVGLALVAGVVLIAVGTMLVRFRVVADKGQLTSYNVKGGAQKVARNDIATIDLRAKPWGTMTRPVEVRVPYVQLLDGSGFWLDPLAGTAVTWPPRAEQLEKVSAIRNVLGLDGELTVTPPPVA